jgi:hypothetical protein
MKAHAGRIPPDANEPLQTRFPLFDNRQESGVTTFPLATLELKTYF